MIERTDDSFSYDGENGLPEYESVPGWFAVTCDLCGSELEEQEGFDEAVAAKKRNGWQSWKDKNGEWVDVCPDCQKKYRSKFNFSRPSAASDFEGVGNNG